VNMKYFLFILLNYLIVSDRPNLSGINFFFLLV